MKLTVASEDVTTLSSGLVGLCCYEDGGSATGFQAPEAFRALDQRLDGALVKLAADEQFKGKKGQSLLVHTLNKVGPERVLLVGLGARKSRDVADLRGYAARVVRSGNGVSTAKVAILAPDDEPGVRVGQLLAEGAELGGYRFNRYLTGDKARPPSVSEVVIVAGANRAAVERGVARGVAVAQAVARARDLVNEPAAALTPTALAAAARAVAEAHGLEAKVLGPAECKALGMGMYLAVSQGSEEEPRFIHLAYKPAGAKKKVALIGKGVTFDSGGLSLKPSNAMEDMKIDMAGSAAVLSAIGALAALGAPVEVHAIAACTENMPSGKSYKLGDVLRSMSGKTVEINNTDAEGRLTLGDAITYALNEVKPDELFDFATLTGACMVALGPHIAGVMSNDDALAGRWLGAAERAGEDMWRLPLPDKLRDQLKSEVADMRNTGDRYGGALTAGLFLKEFVGDTPWVHVDIAGPAASDKEAGHLAKGGTGFAVATIVEYLAGNE